jgi:hypothetical protein
MKFSAGLQPGVAKNMVALFFRGRRGDAEEDQEGAIEAQDIFVGKTANERANLGLGNCGDFVHHQAARGAESVGGAGLDEESKKGRIRWIRGEGAKGNRSGLVEAVVSQDDGGTRLACIVFAAGNSPDFAAPHTRFPSERSSSEMASMKSWSSLA